MQAQTPAVDASAIPFKTLQSLQADDSSDVIIAKAAKLLPRPNQTDWMRLERTFFIHFGPNTFRGVEWGTGQEDPSVFNPTELNAEQWMRSVQEGGGKMVILVCKHHDGLSLWPTRYSPHSIAASPWRGGKGNLVREVAEAAHKYNIKLGVYLSPADLYQLRTNPSNPGGYYGDGSAIVPTVIPTDPTSFKTDPAKARPAGANSQAFHYEVDDYNRYFLNELYELLTEYGRIDEVWFDGANPDPSVHETYAYNAWYDMIRHLQPHAIIFGKGPDGRWVGNEGGVGRTTEWDVIPLPKPPDQFLWPDMTDADLGSRAKLLPGSFLWWYPAETNVPILHGWFWAAGKRSRTAAELINIYYASVGRNSNWLLNLSPDTRGLIPDVQVAHLRQMNQVIDHTFAVDLAGGGTLIAGSSGQDHGAASALDGNLDTWWEAAPGRTAEALTLKLPHPVSFDVVSLQEAVDHRGQRIESFSVDAWEGQGWSEVTRGTTVGHKRLLRLEAPVTASQVRIRITGSRREPTLAEVGLFKQAAFTRPPVISDRDSHGFVAIASPEGLPVVYTLDGSAPTDVSSRYRSPFALPRGGDVEAACLGANGQVGMLASKNMPGLASVGWKVVHADSEAPTTPAANAIDGQPDTLWQTQSHTGAQSLTVDMGVVHKIAGLTYLPRQDGSHVGFVQKYRFESSVDGRSWTPDVSSGTFPNLFNSPELQIVHFPATEARYFRFTALEGYEADPFASVAEISVLPAAQTDGTQGKGTEHK